MADAAISPLRGTMSGEVEVCPGRTEGSPPCEDATGGLLVRVCRKWPPRIFGIYKHLNDASGQCPIWCEHSVERWLFRGLLCYAMRGGGWDMMSSTCVQSGGLPRTIGGGGYDPSHMMEARSPAPAWPVHHNIIATTAVVKQEPMDHDSSAYGSGSDGFHSSSPGESDHNSRDSNPPSVPYTSTHVTDNMQISHYYSTPISNRIPVSTVMSYHHQPSVNGFNPLTPPNFELIISPKIQIPEKVNESFSEVERDPNTTLTPCTTPPSEVTPPKSQKNTPSSECDDAESSYYEGKQENEDHLRRLQMAFERNGMLPASPKGSENRDSGEEDRKSDYEMDEVDEQGLRIPRVNSHGKVKTFKCKQCEFIAVTKLDFWEHSRGHIKAEKILTCPKCPFVTEYKHHLEYHLRNHFGSKPFKCDKCSYSCVNKSMLNSHLKSHSNVYQYRCSDCTYATKYCHSLKLHLRKYKHSPAMVLNPDGTPNPLPIIDVYGTRRGPKTKAQKAMENNEMVLPPAPQQNTLPQHSIFPHFMLQNSQQPPMSIPFPYGSLLGAFPGALGNPLLFPQMNAGQLSPNDRSSPEYLKIDEDSPEIRVNEEDEREPSPSPQQTTEDAAALDLSKPEITLPINVPEIPIQTPTATVNTNKNRRKGRAFKLERLSVPQDVSSDEEEPQVNEVKETMEAVVPEQQAKIEQKVIEVKKADIFNCQYCDIAFKDVVMYTMHMGYHGYKDPFTCNMCGEQSADKSKPQTQRTLEFISVCDRKTINSQTALSSECEYGGYFVENTPNK
ncbi:hunchback [Carabus blaptoides fortunei]